MKILTGLAIIIFIGLILSVGVISFRNTMVSMNKTIEAQVSDMKAKYNEYFNKVKEVAQVPKEQISQFKDIYDKLISGRNADGAMFKWIGENNIQINQETYVEIQRIIASGRSEIYNIQKIHIDTVREYNTLLITFPNNIINSTFFKFKEKTPTVPISNNIDSIFISKEDKVINIFDK